MLSHLILACCSRLPLTTRGEEDRQRGRHRPWQEPPRPCHPLRQDSPPRKMHHRCPPQKSRLSSCPPAAHCGRNLTRGQKNLNRLGGGMGKKQSFFYRILGFACSGAGRWEYGGHMRPDRLTPIEGQARPLNLETTGDALPVVFTWRRRGSLAVIFVEHLGLAPLLGHGQRVRVLHAQI